MTLNEYQEKAKRTINKNLNKLQTEDHALKGLASEVGELNGLYKKVYQGHTLDTNKCKKECGDILWMLAEYCTVNNWTLEEIAQMNQDKLQNRYPDGFDAEKSLNRKDGDD